MDGQYSEPFAAGMHTISFHFTLPGLSTCIQLSLSSRIDFGEQPYVTFGISEIFDADGNPGYISAPFDYPPLPYKTPEGGYGEVLSDFAINRLTDVFGSMSSGQCFAVGFINFFYWPHVEWHY